MSHPSGSPSRYSTRAVRKATVARPGNPLADARAWHDIAARDVSREGET